MFGPISSMPGRLAGLYAQKNRCLSLLRTPRIANVPPPCFEWTPDMRLALYQIDAFASQVFTGSPAAVADFNTLLEQSKTVPKRETKIQRR